MYDSCDLNHVVALTENGKKKFLLHNKMTVGMGYKNTTPEQLEYHQQIRDYNLDRKEEILQTYIMDDAIIEDIISNTPLALGNDEEAALKLMFTTHGQQKEAIQDAKGLHKVKKQIERTAAKEERKQTAIANKSWQDQQTEYLNSKTDINQYLD
jgi:hypothetical protein